MNAVLVIDMLRGFLEERYALYCGRNSRLIIPNIRALLKKELTAGSRIIFLCDQHAPDDLEFRIFPPHCIKNTTEAEIIPELRKYRGEIIPKTRYSAFYNTPLESKLAEIAPEKLIICGVCTDICVCHNVADARNRDYEVEVPVNCVASFDDEAHRFALEHMERVLGAKLIGPEGEN